MQLPEELLQIPFKVSDLVKVYETLLEPLPMNFDNLGKSM